MGGSPFGIDVATISSIAREVKKVHKLGYQICIIIGGGNIFRGIKGASEGIDRSTFLIMKGKVVKVWRKVKVNNHVEEVIDTIKQMNK